MIKEEFLKLLRRDYVRKLLYALFITLFLINILPIQLNESTNEVHANGITTEKTIKNDILYHLSNYNSTFTLTYKGDYANVKGTIHNAMEDIRKNNQYIYENISKWQIAIKYRGNSGTLTFQINYLTDKVKEDYVKAEVKKILPQIIKKGATDFDKVKAVHDYIVLNSSYSNNTKGSQYSTYTLLTENQGVCQAYALLMLKMLEELKLEAKYVKGYSNNERHAWILVKVDGAWYHVDPTWDDPINNDSDKVHYDYFMLSDKQIAATHSWEKTEYPVAQNEKSKNVQKTNKVDMIGFELLSFTRKFINYIELH